MRSLVAAVGLCGGTMACDGVQPVVDASAPPSVRTSAVSLRIDVPKDKPASLTVLAFNAAFSGIAPSEVLGLVDPLAADAPTRDCQLRDVGQATAALVARGDAIELEELSGVGIAFGAGDTQIHPSPRLYPDMAATIGGVVGEAGPVSLVPVPVQLRVFSSPGGLAADGSPDATTVAVPTAGWVKLLNGTVPDDGALVEIAADLHLSLNAGALVGGDAQTSDVRTSIELRPLGTTVALTCAVTAAAGSLGGDIAFTVPRQALGALVSASGSTPGAPLAAGLDLVRRSNQRLPLSDTRVSVEVRTSTLVEIRP